MAGVIEATFDQEVSVASEVIFEGGVRTPFLCTDVNVLFINPAQGCDQPIGIGSTCCVRIYGFGTPPPFGGLTIQSFASEGRAKIFWPEGTVLAGGTGSDFFEISDNDNGQIAFGDTVMIRTATSSLTGISSYGNLFIDDEPDGIALYANKSASNYIKFGTTELAIASAVPTTISTTIEHFKAGSIGTAVSVVGTASDATLYLLDNQHYVRADASGLDIDSLNIINMKIGATDFVTITPNSVATPGTISLYRSSPTDLGFKFGTIGSFSVSGTSSLIETVSDLSVESPTISLGSSSQSHLLLGSTPTTYGPISITGSAGTRTIGFGISGNNPTISEQGDIITLDAPDGIDSSVDSSVVLRIRDSSVGTSDTLTAWADGTYVGLEFETSGSIRTTMDSLELSHDTEVKVQDFIMVNSGTIASLTYPTVTTQRIFFQGGISRIEVTPTTLELDHPSRVDINTGGNGLYIDGNLYDPNLSLIAPLTIFKSNGIDILLVLTDALSTITRPVLMTTGSEIYFSTQDTFIVRNNGTFDFNHNGDMRFTSGSSVTQILSSDSPVSTGLSLFSSPIDSTIYFTPDIYINGIASELDIVHDSAISMKIGSSEIVRVQNNDTVITSPFYFFYDGLTTGLHFNNSDNYIKVTATDMIISHLDDIHLVAGDDLEITTGGSLIINGSPYYGGITGPENLFAPFVVYESVATVPNTTMEFNSTDTTFNVPAILEDDLRFTTLATINYSSGLVVESTDYVQFNVDSIVDSVRISGVLSPQGSKLHLYGTAAQAGMLFNGITTSFIDSTTNHLTIAHPEFLILNINGQEIVRFDDSDSVVGPRIHLSSDGTDSKLYLGSSTSSIEMNASRALYRHGGYEVHSIGGSEILRLDDNKSNLGSGFTTFVDGTEIGISFGASSKTIISDTDFEFDHSGNFVYSIGGIERVRMSTSALSLGSGIHLYHDNTLGISGTYYQGLSTRRIVSSANSMSYDHTGLHAFGIGGTEIGRFDDSIGTLGSGLHMYNTGSASGVFFSGNNNRYIQTSTTSMDIGHSDLLQFDIAGSTLYQIDTGSQAEFSTDEFVPRFYKDGNTVATRLVEYDVDFYDVGGNTATVADVDTEFIYTKRIFAHEGLGATDPQSLGIFTGVWQRRSAAAGAGSDVRTGGNYLGLYRTIEQYDDKTAARQNLTDRGGGLVFIRTDETTGEAETLLFCRTMDGRLFLANALRQNQTIVPAFTGGHPVKRMSNVYPGMAVIPENDPIKEGVDNMGCAPITVTNALPICKICDEDYSTALYGIYAMDEEYETSLDSLKPTYCKTDGSLMPPSASCDALGYTDTETRSMIASVGEGAALVILDPGEEIHPGDTLVSHSGGVLQKDTPERLNAFMESKFGLSYTNGFEDIFNIMHKYSQVVKYRVVTPWASRIMNPVVPMVELKEGQTLVFVGIVFKD